MRPHERAGRRYAQSGLTLALLALCGCWAGVPSKYECSVEDNLDCPAGKVCLNNLKKCAPVHSAGVKQWTAQLGTISDEVAYTVATDGSGNVYAVGVTSGGLGGTSAGGLDLFVVKFNSAGVRQWTQQFGTVSDDLAYAVTIDAGANLYAAGYTNGGLDGATNAGGSDLFVVKYNTAGIRQWTRQLGTVTADGASAVASDASSNIYAAGYTLGGLDGNVSAGFTDLFVVKYDSAGVKQWTRQLGTATDDTAHGAATDANGNVFAAGWTGGGLDNTSAGGSDLFVVKYDPVGVKQ